MKLSTSDRWEELKTEILQKIQDINNNTPWQNSEPQWWLEMMEVANLIAKQNKKHEKI